jgi:hypothetical protein
VISESENLKVISQFGYLVKKKWLGFEGLVFILKVHKAGLFLSENIPAFLMGK